MWTERASLSQTDDQIGLISVDRTIIQLTLAEDGWSLEVEDSDGVHLSYWITDIRSVPPPGTIARFYHGNRDRRLCALEIDGQVVFNVCPDQHAMPDG